MYLQSLCRCAVVPACWDPGACGRVRGSRGVATLGATSTGIIQSLGKGLQARGHAEVADGLISAAT